MRETFFLGGGRAAKKALLRNGCTKVHFQNTIKISIVLNRDRLGFWVRLGKPFEKVFFFFFFF